MGALMKQGGLQLQDVLFWTVPAFYVISAGFFYLAGESVLHRYQVEASKVKKA